MRPKLDLPNCLAILRACDKRPRTSAELMRATGMSRATLFRALNDLREQLRAEVDCIDGRYEISDWGIVNRTRALQ